ncbi:MAG TPA: RluA family pseudouridine synthase [Epulopiscium sp.]|nr:RluA family pseudouridine synthase [Candidatus Epulonipiscium sp.]
MKLLIINENEGNQRLDKFLLKYFNKAPKSFVYKMIRKKNIKYNGKRAKGNEILMGEDEIQVYLSDDTIDNFREIKKTPSAKPTFEVIYEDSNILIVNKPLGLLTQPDAKGQNTLTEQVLTYLHKKGEYNPKDYQGFRPAPCNRLDRNTAGIILVGKSLQATQAIHEMLRTREISKYYMSIVLGKVVKPIILKGYHEKDESRNEVKITQEYVEGAKEVETRILPLQDNGRYTLIEVQLVTGKTHQIRAHLATINHPIVGDPKYGDKEENEYFFRKYSLRHQFLCAYKIKFEMCTEPLKYLENKVFTVGAPSLYSQIFQEEGFISL